MGITLREVSFSYGKTAVLQRLSVSFPEQGIFALSAPSGGGKTTLLRLLSGLLQPDSGTIAGQPQAPVLLFQENRLLPWETALGNLRLVCDDSQTVQALLRRVGLSEAEGLYPHEMSGGMQRRLALARALALPGDALLLDEPFTGIDRERVADLCPVLRDIGHTRPVFLVTHTAEEAAWLGASVWELTGRPVTDCRRLPPTL